MARQLIVVDSSHPLVRQNRCFDPAHEYTGCGHAIHVRLAREAKRRGIDVVTADVYSAMPDRPAQAVCLTDMVTPFTDKLLSNGVLPAVCMSLESPLSAKEFYHNIERYAGRFRHNYQFRGAQERLLATDTIFHPIVFPIETRKPLPLQTWSERNYLVLVNSNKRAIYRNWSNFKEIARTMVRQIRYWRLRAVDPWMRIREGFVDRIEAIRYFARYADFYLYGLGWDQPIQGFGPDYHQAALKAYQGSIPANLQSKREVMSHFKFAICFENCSFPGYVTEKVFDCFLAGCIPVYFGAPDIADFIPPETFVDYRQFSGFADLDRFLRAMSEAESRIYLDAARAFLASTSFDKITTDYMVKDILSVLENEIRRIA